jgi:hypothetical protein
MARHSSLPEFMTIESLADYIRSNKVDTINHVEKIPLTEEEINKLAMESSLASRAIDKLESVKKYFESFLKKGTPWDTNAEDHRPLTVTIPPTKGTEKLKSNRKFADDQIAQGYREDVTSIYLLPWPEKERMVACDIEGREWTTYSRGMSGDEIKQHGKPILKAVRNQMPLRDDEREELDL